jgi:hypothetical protein
MARELLRSALPTRSMPQTSRARGARRIARLASAPMVALGVGLLSKAAAAGFGLGVATAVVVVVGVPSVRSRLLAPALAPVEMSVSTPPPTPRAPVTTPEPPSASLDQPADVLPVAEPKIAKPAHALRPPPSPTASRPVDELIEPPSGWAAAPAAPPAAERGISAEVGILLDARRKLDSDPVQAIALLARHSGDFPAGELAMEREVLMIEALDRTGQRVEALRRAHELLARSPNAFYASRLKDLVARR